MIWPYANLDVSKWSQCFIADCRYQAFTALKLLRWRLASSLSRESSCTQASCTPNYKFQQDRASVCTSISCCLPLYNLLPLYLFSILPSSCLLSSHTPTSLPGIKAPFKTTSVFYDHLSLSLPLELQPQDCFHPADRKRSVRPGVVFAKAV